MCQSQFSVLGTPSWIKQTKPYPHGAYTWEGRQTTVTKQKISNDEHHDEKQSRTHSCKMINSDDLNKVVKEVLLGGLTTKQKPLRRKQEGRAFQAEGSANAKAPRLKLNCVFKVHPGGTVMRIKQNREGQTWLGWPETCDTGPVHCGRDFGFQSYSMLITNTPMRQVEQLYLYFTSGKQKFELNSELFYYKSGDLEDWAERRGGAWECYRMNFKGDVNCRSIQKLGKENMGWFLSSPLPPLCVKFHH